MSDNKLLDRITCDSKIMMGKPVVRGTRLTVEFILNLRGHGSTEEEILAEYSGLTVEDIQACYLYAGKSLDVTSYVPLIPEKV